MGCTTEIIRENNNTIIREIHHVEVIKYINISPVCPELPEPINCSIPDKLDYTNNLTACHSQMDILNAELHLCLIRNTTTFADDLYENYTKCYREREDNLNIVNNISEIMKGR